MADCGLITAGVAYDCANPQQGGVNAKLRLANYDDISAYTISGTVDNQITGITLKTGKQFFVFEGFRNSLTPSYAAVAPDTGQTLYTHQANFFIFDNQQVTKNEIQKLALGRFVAIIENNGKDANSFEVLGRGNGLELVAGDLKNANENNGAYNIILATLDGEFETKLPQTFYDETSYASTLAIVEGYEVPAV